MRMIFVLVFVFGVRNARGKIKKRHVIVKIEGAWITYSSRLIETRKEKSWLMAMISFLALPNSSSFTNPFLFP